MRKADKKVPGSIGNIANLDATGNLADSGKKTTDFQDKLPAGTAGQILTYRATGPAWEAAPESGLQAPSETGDWVVSYPVLGGEVEYKKIRFVSAWGGED